MIHEQFRAAIKWYAIQVRVKVQRGGGGGEGGGGEREGGGEKEKTEA